MSDLDFDELDQAVASAMQGSGRSVPERPVAPRPVERSFATPRPSTPVSKRTSGRFMDVVHPSSDMRPGKTEETQESSSPSPHPAEADNQPDLLDFEDFMMKSKEDSSEPADGKGDNQPLSSPFLSGAKIEKRPLGAFSASDAKGEDEPDSPAKKDFALPPFQLPDALKDEKEVAVKSEKEFSLEEQKSEQPLPAELQEDLLTVERDATLIETATPEMSPDTVKAPSTVIEPGKTKDSSARTPPMPSIVQQYKERASSTEQATGAIFDTETYHKPMATLPQKKNTWLIIVWILGLIILGGGLGAAAYFFVLPLLV